MSQRLDLLRPILSTYQRRFSVFDFGSGIQDGVGHEIAKEYDAVVVCAEQDPLRYEPSGRMMVLRKAFTVEDLEALAKCEHFDVVLALNILHWCDDKWLRTLRALRSMSKWMIVQTPYENDIGACGQGWVQEIIEACREPEVEQLGETVQFPEHLARPIYLFLNDMPHFLTAKSFGDTSECIRASVTSDPFAKFIHLHHKKERWLYCHGLTLQSFLDLNGAWPTKKVLIEKLKALLPAQRHGDIQPWNIRMAGDELTLIDPGGADWSGTDEENLAGVIAAVEAVALATG